MEGSDAGVKLAVEVGGTFTDVVWIDGGGTLRTQKVPSTPHDPSQGVIAGVRHAVGPGAAPLQRFLHGSTVATNTVLERKGPPTGFVTTRGFGDVLATQRQLRQNVYAVVSHKPQPLISPGHVVEVGERTAADGNVVVALDETGVVEDIRRLVQDHDVHTVGVCLLHSYKNAVHERRIRELVTHELPDVTVILSSDVLPTFREYERASTTAMCAYVAKVVDGYIHRLERYLEPRAPLAPLFIMQSSGGVLPSSGVRRRPIEMLNSGPAAGVIGAVRIAGQAGYSNVITFDMGGTSTDVCLVVDGEPAVTSDRHVDGLPVAVPSLDITNVGAGGGSIGWVDPGGMLRTGPRSAGADPGPACYGRGGEEATLTDAVVHLGWIRGEHFLGGEMPLQEQRAAEALAMLAGPLEVSTTDMAQSIVDIAVNHNSNAVRVVSTQRGHDPQDYALCGYGGMGPLVAALVAEQMRIHRVLVPPHPGLFSAVGLLLADLERTYQRTVFLPIDEGTVSLLLADFASLQAVAVEEFERYGHARAQLSTQAWLEMRYVGQGFELVVPVDLASLQSGGHQALISLFHGAHRHRYGTSAPSDAIEIVNCRLVVRVPNQGDVLAQLRRADELTPSEPDTAQVWFQGQIRRCEFARRSTLPPGYQGEGLMVIEEPTATTLVPPGWRATVGDAGMLSLERVE